MKALIMKPGADSLETIELPDDETGNYKAIRKLIQADQPVEGWLTTCFRVLGERGRLVAFCDDEFLLNGRQDWCVLLGETLRGDAPYPIGGPVVIVGETQGGDTRGLTNNEASHFTLSKPIRAGGLRVLQWEG
jgi:hypothetical protein